MIAQAERKLEEAAPASSEFPALELMMALVIGDEALVYQRSTGVMCGRELKEEVVGRGLGIDGMLSFD